MRPESASVIWGISCWPSGQSPREERLDQGVRRREIGVPTPQLPSLPNETRVPLTLKDASDMMKESCDPMQGLCHSTRPSGLEFA